jgi:insulysin
MKESIFSVCLFLSFQGAIASETLQLDYELVEDKASLPVLNPALAERKTAKLRFKNGLEAYLISDPGVDQSAAALTVKVGSWEDPEAYPGMAHFCEHMLFMGTTTYPEEMDYMRFIRDNGGQVNAMTYPDHTTYLFSVNNDAFLGALDRLSHFFTDPIFSRSGIDREMQAVDQEHAKNVEMDGYRQYMVFKETANPKHPNACFSTGNAKTLSGIPQETLRQWYQDHYSADKMQLVAISPMPLEELIAYTSPRFSTIPVTSQPEVQRPEITSPKQRGHIIYQKPIRDLKTISFMWELPKEFAQDIDRGASSLIAYALSNKSENSLIEQLKREKIAEQISVSTDRFSKNDLFFNIDITLTEQGLSQIDTVILRTFQAIACLKASGIPASLFEERRKMAKIHYQYQSREDAFQAIMTHAGNLLYEDLETYPEKTYTYTTYDPAFLSSFLQALTPESCIYFVLADPNQLGITTDTKEQWMGVEYTVREIAPEKLVSWKEVNTHPQISLVPSNSFIPMQLEIMPAPEEKPPTLIADDEIGRLYYAPDARYFVPEAAALLSFKSPLLDGSAKSCVLADLYLRAVREKLSSTLFFAGAAGLNSSFSQRNMQLTLFVQGYSEKLPAFLKECFTSGKHVIPTKEQFELYKRSLGSSYDNFSKELAFHQARETMASVLFNDQPTNHEKYKALQTISYEDFIYFSQSLFKKVNIDGLIYGNLEEADAEHLWVCLKNTLAAAPYPSSEQKNKRVLLLPEKHGPFMITQQTDMQGNAVFLLLEEGAFTFEKRAAQQVLSTALQDAFFVTLRTKQQTGYIARSWDAETERQLFQCFAVQSSTHHPVDLLARYELFLEDFLKNIRENITEERFENIQKMLLTSLKMPPENMESMALLLNMLAFEYEGDFNWLEKRIQAVEALTYDQLLLFAQQSLSRANSRRLAILVEGNLPPENDFHYERITKEDIRGLGTYVTWRQ